MLYNLCSQWHGMVWKGEQNIVYPGILNVYITYHDTFDCSFLCWPSCSMRACRLHPCISSCSALLSCVLGRHPQCLGAVGTSSCPPSGTGWGLRTRFLSHCHSPLLSHQYSSPHPRNLSPLAHGLFEVDLGRRESVCHSISAMFCF